MKYCCNRIGILYLTYKTTLGTIQLKFILKYYEKEVFQLYNSFLITTNHSICFEKTDAINMCKFIFSSKSEFNLFLYLERNFILTIDFFIKKIY